VCSQGMSVSFLTPGKLTTEQSLALSQKLHDGWGEKASDMSLEEIFFDEHTKCATVSTAC